MYCSYSGFGMHDKCPFSYWHSYIAKTRPPELDNRVNMLFGSVTGVIFEQFYNEKMWRLPNFVEEMVQRIPVVLKKVISEETADGKNGVIAWNDRRANYHSPEEVLKDVESAVRRGVRSIKQHRLVGHDAAAEVKLDGKFGDHILGGRADFVMRRVAPDNDKIILDGKGSKFREGYVDKRQLRWYAMLYENKFQSLPDKMGFLYWRCEPESSIDWVVVTKEDTAFLRSMVTKTLDSIEKRKLHLPVVPEPTREQVLAAFPAQPSPDCKWCNFLSSCESGTRYMKNKGKAPMPISDGDPNGTGVDDVGL